MRPGHDIRTSGQTVEVLNPGAPISNDANSAATWVLSGELPTSLPPKARVLLLNIPAMAATLAWLDRQAPASVAITLSYSLCTELLCEAPRSYERGHVMQLSDSLCVEIHCEAPRSYERGHVVQFSDSLCVELLCEAPRSYERGHVVQFSDSLCVELHCEAWFTSTDRQPSVRAVRVIGGTGLSVPDWLPFSEP